MSNMVIVAAVLGRLRNLIPVANQRVIAKVNYDLLRMLEQLKQIMEDAEANHNTTDDQAKNFRKIMRVCLKLEDLIESYPRRNRLQDMISRRSRQQIEVIERLSEELAGMISSIPNPLVTPPVMADAVETEELLVQMEDEKALELRDVLIGRNSGLDVVSICGMPGMGKTTLATKLYQDRVIAGHFQVLYWVCLSDAFDSKGFLQKILALASKKSFERREAKDMREEDLAELVYRSLKGLRYLIVLDNVWSVDAWLSLRMAFPDDSNGSRVLISTPSMLVAEQVGGHIHMLRLLSDQESWDLLRRRLNDDTESNAKPERELIGREIAKLCRGLPLNVILISGLLSKTPLNRWKELAEQLSSPIVSTGERVHDIIELSYKHLPLQLRPCLLYLGMFPEDTVIEWKTICQLWLAEGFISMEDISIGETMMDVAARYLDELINRNLVIVENHDSRQRRLKSFRIHGLIHNFCITKGKQDEFFEVIHLRNEKQNMRLSIRCAIHFGKSEDLIHFGKSEYSHSHLYGNADYLRSLLFFDSNQSDEREIRQREIPSLDNFIWLRVLYFYHVDFIDGKLSKGIEKLVYLRYLSFRESYLEELSLVGNMLYLETLDLRARNECEMILSNVFNGFKRLKYLYFPRAYCTSNHEKLHLEKLKELEIVDNFDTSICNVEDLHGFSNLQDLTVTTRGDVLEIETILIALQNNNTNQFLSLSLNIKNFDCHSRRRFSCMEKVFDSSVLHVLKVEGHLGKLPEFDLTSSKLTEIILNGSELVEDPMQILKDLPNLSILVLEMEAYKMGNMKCSSDGFRALTYLKLVKLYNLKSWEVEEEAMPSLCTLVIEDCKKLQMLPDGLKYCKKLLKLEIASMPNAFVEKIQRSDGIDGEDFYKIQHEQPIMKINDQPLIHEEKTTGANARRRIEGFIDPQVGNLIHTPYYVQGPREYPWCSNSVDRPQ